jgi:hypothetical protein
MAAVAESNLKNRGSEATNSTSAMARVVHRMVSSFLMKRRMIAPASGKKIKKDRMGIPKMSMKLAPFYLYE